MAEIVERKMSVLIETRGYHIVKRSEFKDAVQFLVKTHKQGEMILMRCSLSEKIGVELLRTMLGTMNKAGIKRGIFVAHGNVTYQAKVLARKNGIELIPKEFPSFNLLKHDLVPLHEILMEKERKEMLKKYRVKVYQLPRMASSDPAVTAIGGRPGDVIRIVRESPTAGKHIFYRYIVEETGKVTQPKEDYAEIYRTEATSYPEETED